MVLKRITIKNLVSDFFHNNLGWDNRFFRTIKNLILRPGVLLREFLTGTRKKYVAPFAFLAITLTINLFFFNTFDDDFVRVNQAPMETQIDAMTKQMEQQMGDDFDATKFKEKQLEQSEKTTKILLKYFNLFTILVLPLYAFFAFIIYRKPYNYGEHLVVTSYVQGFSFLTGTVLFLVSIITIPLIYTLTLPLLVIYYTYVYGKLYKLSIGKSILKAVTFMGLVILIFLVLGVLLYIAGYLFGRILGSS